MRGRELIEDCHRQQADGTFCSNNDPNSSRHRGCGEVLSVSEVLCYAVPEFIALGTVHLKRRGAQVALQRCLTQSRSGALSRDG